MVKKAKTKPKKAKPDPLLKWARQKLTFQESYYAKKAVLLTYFHHAYPEGHTPTLAEVTREAIKEMGLRYDHWSQFPPACMNKKFKRWSQMYTKARAVTTHPLALAEQLSLFTYNMSKDVPSDDDAVYPPTQDSHTVSEEVGSNNSKEKAEFINSKPEGTPPPIIKPTNIINQEKVEIDMTQSKKKFLGYFTENEDAFINIHKSQERILWLQELITKEKEIATNAWNNLGQKMFK